MGSIQSTAKISIQATGVKKHISWKLVGFLGRLYFYSIFYSANPCYAPVFRSVCTLLVSWQSYRSKSYKTNTRFLFQFEYSLFHLFVYVQDCLTSFDSYVVLRLGGAPIKY